MTEMTPESTGLQTAKPRLANLLHDELGQDLIEYALVAALIGLGAVTTLKGLSNRISNAFNGIGTDLTNDV